MMRKSEPGTFGALGTSGKGHLPASAPMLAEILKRLPLRRGGRLPGDALVLIPEGAADATLPISSEWAVYRLPSVRANAWNKSVSGVRNERLVLPFTDGAFDTVCMYGLILKVVQRRDLLDEIMRVLKIDGTVVVVEPVENFNFAPFPVGGPAHLVRRHLFEAGLCDVRQLSGTDRLLVFVAEREAEAE